MGFTKGICCLLRSLWYLILQNTAQKIPSDLPTMAPPQIEQYLVGLGSDINERF